MTEFLKIDELAAKVLSGARLGIGGVHLARLPIALIQSVIKLGRRNFTFVGWGGGLALELLLEAEAVGKLVFCFSSLDIFGLAPRFREALEDSRLEVEEWSALAMTQALHAAQFNLPEMPFQLPVGSDLMRRGDFWKAAPSAFTGEVIGEARRLDVDVLLLHAQRADRAGNIEIQGARGLDLAMLGAARRTLVTVEQIVDVGQIGEAPRSFALPHTFVDAVALAPGGAYPTSCLPYYATDYRRLLDYVRTERAQRKSAASSDDSGQENSSAGQRRVAPHFAWQESPQKFLHDAAGIRVADLTAERLDGHRLEIDDDAPCTVDELLAVCLAREYENTSVCSVGSVSPLAMVSYLLAKRTHAPGLTLIALNGGFIDIDVHPMSLILAEPLALETAKVCWGGDETYHWYYQSGRITHEVITVAQVDVQGRTNNAWIEGEGKRVRLPGQGGMADVANLHKNFVLYLTRHSPERFTDRVKLCTASRGLLGDNERRRAGLQPGKVRLISDLGVFELSADERRFRLMTLHPGVSLERVREQTGGEILVDGPLRATPAPSLEQLRLIRCEIDPFGIRRLEFVPAKQRLGMIESILDSEAKLVAEIQRKRK